MRRHIETPKRTVRRSLEFTCYVFTHSSLFIARSIPLKDNKTVTLFANINENMYKPSRYKSEARVHMIFCSHYCHHLYRCFRLQNVELIRSCFLRRYFKQFVVIIRVKSLFVLFRFILNNVFLFYN
jgi:hypothetical protein